MNALDLDVEQRLGVLLSNLRSVAMQVDGIDELRARRLPDATLLELFAAHFREVGRGEMDDIVTQLRTQVVQLTTERDSAARRVNELVQRLADAPYVAQPAAPIVVVKRTWLRRARDRVAFWLADLSDRLGDS